MTTLEKSYSQIYKNILRVVSPIKKRIIKTECIVHKYINNQAMIILKNDGNNDTYNFLFPYIDEINDGVVWADQDLKSSDHFYNPHYDRGLYGNSDAKKECIFYYNKALKEYFKNNMDKAAFYLGAACHLVQDLTVPQHANIKLLHNHRRYEKWVIKTYKKYFEFTEFKGGIYLLSLKQYINLNSTIAINIYNKFSKYNNHISFYKITSVTLPLAQKTTAGLMHKFFYDIQKLKPILFLKKD